MKIIFSFLFVTLAVTGAVGQQASYFDPAQAYNKLLVEKNNGNYYQISNYKVTGTPFLFGEKNNGNIYSPNETAYNIYLSYNIYDQNLDFYSTANPNTPLVKDPGTLDSFLLKRKPGTGLEKDILFVYGPTVLGSKDKAYYQVVSKGGNVNLYKRYTGELGIVGTNYIQSELRQFNVLVDYFYTDSTGKGLKKLKVNPASIKKEFASIKDLSGYIDADLLTTAREQELTKLFTELNRQ
jgi:hypothetical protein